MIADLLNGHLLARAVLLILLVKAGGAMGWLVGLVLPGSPGFWALLGMAAMLGGTMRAPLTGAPFAVELTGNLPMLPALLAATAAAYAVTVLLLRRSMLTEKIVRRGQHITREYGVDPYELTRMGEVMVRQVDTVSLDLPLTDAVRTLEAGRHRIYPAVDAAGRPAWCRVRMRCAGVTRAEGERLAFLPPSGNVPPRRDEAWPAT